MATAPVSKFGLLPTSPPISLLHEKATTQVQDWPQGKLSVPANYFNLMQFWRGAGKDKDAYLRGCTRLPWIKCSHVIEHSAPTVAVYGREETSAPASALEKRFESLAGWTSPDVSALISGVSEMPSSGGLEALKEQKKKVEGIYLFDRSSVRKLNNPPELKITLENGLEEHEAQTAKRETDSAAETDAAPEANIHTRNIMQKNLWPIAVIIAAIIAIAKLRRRELQGDSEDETSVPIPSSSSEENHPFDQPNYPDQSDVKIRDQSAAGTMAAALAEMARSQALQDDFYDMARISVSTCDHAIAILDQNIAAASAAASATAAAPTAPLIARSVEYTPQQQSSFADATGATASAQAAAASPFVMAASIVMIVCGPVAFICFLLTRIYIVKVARKPANKMYGLMNGVMTGVKDGAQGFTGKWWMAEQGAPQWEKEVDMYADFPSNEKP